MSKEYIKSLIEKYLAAETNPAQERLLAEWLSAHKAEADEEAVAKLILAEYPEATCDAAEKEYDAVVSEHGRRTRVVRWACGFAACVAVAIGLGIFFTQRNSSDFNGQEIAQGIEQIMSLDMDNVQSVTATPKGNKVILTAIMNDGTRCSYVMSKDDGADALSITAMK